LDEKLKSGLDRDIALEDFPKPIEDWTSLKGVIISAISEHNGQIGDTGKVTEQAREKIEAHYIAELCNEVDFTQADTIQNTFKRRVTRRQSLITKCRQRISNLEDEIRRNSVAAERLNELLQILLPNSNVKAHPINDSTFEFQRDGNPARYLSDGEKTAITFAYFLITLEDQGSSIEDFTVFIDDPISSLDSNHIYAVWSLINERLKQCNQLFVSTHNSELFTLIKDEWVNARNQQNFSAEHAGYWISRYTDQSGQPQSKIEKLPDLLRKYKSEYQFVYACLHTFAYAQTPSPHEAYTAPNLLRKFLEAYLGFRKPSGGAWHAKLDLLIDCPVRRKEIHKFSDDASHIQKPARITEHPSYLANAQSLCKEVIEALRAKDLGHHGSLGELL
jgi:wobble nucleotide-excising tRNase